MAENTYLEMNLLKSPFQKLLPAISKALGIDEKTRKLENWFPMRQSA